VKEEAKKSSRRGKLAQPPGFKAPQVQPKMEVKPKEQPKKVQLVESKP
jgi:hypothetical protein